MMRIAQLVPQFAVGGGERVAMQLLCELKRRGHVVLGIALGSRSESEMTRRLDQAGIQVEYLAKHKGFEPKLVAMIFQMLRKFNPDVVHSHNHVLPYLLPYAARHRGRIVHTVHSMADYDATGANRVINALAFRLGVVPVAIADEVRASIRRVYGMNAPIVKNGIPVDQYRKAASSRSEWRSANGVREADLLFVAIGALWPVKNHAKLIAAFRQVADRVPSAKCFIAGSGPLREQLTRQIHQINLSAKVKLLGERDDVPDVLSACDVAVLPSHCEGSPLSLMEAMAAGKPVIATAVGGVPEMVSGETARLIARDNVNALADAMIELAGNVELRQRMGAAGAHRAAANFGLDRMTAGYEALYSELPVNKECTIHESSLGLAGRRARVVRQ